MKRLLQLSLFVLIAGSIATAAETSKPDDARLQKAREVFDLYVRLERAFDPKVVDLYANDALIRNRRTYPNGQVREMTLPAAQYKELVRQSMPMAKVRGDLSTYKEVTYAVEGDGVRIRATRFSELKMYSSPLSILVKAGPNGAWLIYEELSESQPM